MIEPEQDFSFKNLLVPFTTVKVIHFIVIIGLIVFFTSLFNGFVGDDFNQIIHNQSIHSISNIPKLFAQGTFYDESGQSNNYYRPMLSIAFTLIYSLFGENPFGFHIVQLLLHIGNAFLVFLIVKYFLKKEISFLISLLFLLHPINIEAVVYVSALGENLFLFFGLIALYLTFKKKNNITTTLLVPFFLLMSLFSKETGILFLFLVVLFNFLYQKKVLLKTVIQVLIVIFLYLFFRLVIAHIGFGNQVIIAPIQSLPLNERIINIPKIIYFYITTFFYPKDLITSQTWLVKEITFTNFYLPILCDLTFFGTLLFISKNIFKKNLKYFKTLLFFLCWFLIGLILLFHLIPLDETVSDRWFYFPIIGLLGIGGTLFTHLEDINSNRLKFVFPIILIIIILFSIRTMIRNTNWYNEESLYTHDIKYNSESYQLESGLGKIADLKGDTEEARKHYIRATELFPSRVTFTNLAGYDLQTDRMKEAIIDYNKAHVYSNTNPMSWVYLGIARYKTGDKNGAIADIKKAYAISPNPDFLVVLKTIEKNEPITFKKE